MTNAFRCDICKYICVTDANEARNSREVERSNVTITPVANQPGVEVEMVLQLSAGVPHVCDGCWGLIMKKLKQWAMNNIPD